MNRGRNRIRSYRVWINRTIVSMWRPGHTSFKRLLTPQGTHGYTIVETLIFLAVSAALFVSAMMLMNGQQGRAEFTNAVKDFETRLIDLANDVSTGYYPTTGNFSCRDTGGVPLSTDNMSGNTEQGKNGECVLAGRVIKFGSQSASPPAEGYEIYTVAGLRSASSLQDARPKVINVTNSVETAIFGSGMTVERVRYGSGTGSDSGAIGFFTNFLGEATSAGGTNSVGTVPYTSVNFTDDTVSAISRINNNANYAPATLNPSGGFRICLKSGGTKQYALVRLGGQNGGPLTVTSEIKSYSGATPTCN